jgi:hypothetical protein
VLDRVLAMRLATQRLTSAPFATPEEAVGHLLAVQAQDAPVARWSIAMRCGAARDEEVRAAVDAGRIVRTHVLRPTWHYVRAEDLRWLQALTGAKVASGIAARHRQLRLDDPELTGPRLGHLLMLAELRALICSGPLEREQHTYALVDEWIAPSLPRERDDAVRELVHRFFAGHGPASVAHLVRWAALTGREVRSAIADLDDRLEAVTLGGEPHWFDPAARARARRRAHALLLPVFDEAHLTYPGSAFPRAPDAPPHSFSQSGRGLVVCDLRDVGGWTRRTAGGTATVRLALTAPLAAEQAARVEQQVAALEAFGA